MSADQSILDAVAVHQNVKVNDRWACWTTDRALLGDTIEAIGKLADEQTRGGRNAPSVAEAIYRALLDALLAAQLPCGGWSWDARVATSDPAPYKAQAAHFDDGGVSSCLDAMMGAWDRLADDRYRDACYRALDYVALCQSRSPYGGVPGEASAEGYAMQGRRYEPAGCLSTSATVAIGVAAIGAYERWRRESDKSVVLRCLDYLAATEDADHPDGPWPRYVLAYAETPQPVYGLQAAPWMTVVYDAQQDGWYDGYKWRGTWGNSLRARAGKAGIG